MGSGVLFFLQRPSDYRELASQLTRAALASDYVAHRSSDEWEKWMAFRVDLLAAGAGFCGVAQQATVERGIALPQDETHSICGDLPRCDAALPDRIPPIADD